MSPQSISISRLTLEQYSSPFGIQHDRPRISWRFAGDVKDWLQASCDIELIWHDEPSTSEHFHCDTSESVLVAWPSKRALRSRERATIRVKATGDDGSSTRWHEIGVEAALLNPLDWTGQLLGAPSQDLSKAQRPFHLRKRFVLSPSLATAVTSGRLYITAHGCYKAEINGKLVGDHVLAPGWQSYNHRLHYQTFDVSNLLQNGENMIGVIVGEGWFASRITFMEGRRNVWGADTGAMLQLEVEGSSIVDTASNEGWEWAYGPIITSEIYNGEVYDSRLHDEKWSKPESVTRAKWDWRTDTRLLGRPKGTLIAAECPPVRRTAALRAKKLITTPTGRKILDFAENVVGWLRLEQEPVINAGEQITIRHAEVMENQELGVRPLRTARCEEVLTAGGTLLGYEPSFTFHGFRYVEVDGWPDVNLDSFSLQLLHTDMERTGWFECSHELINKLHSNVLRSLRGNFVSVPTDCPQRDERLGWTGDLAVFASTATFLYDTTSMISTWLQDLSCEQLEDHGGVVPLITPNALPFAPPPSAIWGDVCATAPDDLYRASGDIEILRRQYDSMTTWLRKGVTRRDCGLWKEDMQFGDWLDPAAPPDAPADGQTNAFLVADAWLVHTTKVVACIAQSLGETDDAVHFRKEHEQLRAAFQAEYITKNGRVTSDSQAAITLAVRFGLLDNRFVSKAMQRLETLIRKAIFKVSTGFAATPLILHTLSENGCLQLAYRMLQESHCPSWLYPVTMGGTTIWERWDSMLPDGTINPGEMTSFNHYALGSVASWMHKCIGGLAPLTPGWSNIRIQPRPGGSVRSASTQHLSPYGMVSCEWQVSEDDPILHVEIEVPPNCSAIVILPGLEENVGSGCRSYDVKWQVDETWPPKAIQMPFAPPKSDVPA